MGLLYVIQFMSAFGVIVAILLHSPKGEGLGAIGSSARIFSHVKGLEAGLDRITQILASVFIITSILIAVRAV